MMLSVDQLARHLEGEPAPVYLITGDEPLQLMEAADSVRARAREAGYTERSVFTVDADFRWEQLVEAGGTMSLFAERRLIDLRLPSGKPGTEGARVLAEFAAEPPPDTLLLIQAGRLESAAMKSKWVRAIDAVGVVLRVWPLRRDETRAWLAERMRARGLQPDGDALDYLAERVEGNLLAAAQEVEKLLLLEGEGPVTLETLRRVAADQSRYDSFDLADAVLEGDARRAVHVLEVLLAEGTAAPLILWALARDFRLLEELAVRSARGHDLERLMNERRVFPQRRRLVRGAAQRFSAAHWRELLARCARIDRLAKGVGEGALADELLQLVLSACGQALFAVRERA